MDRDTRVDARTGDTTETPFPERARRVWGSGGIEEHADGSCRGHYRDGAGSKQRLPWCTNRRDAEEQLQATLEMIAQDGAIPVGRLTLRKWCEQFLERREKEGNRAARKDKSP